MAKTKKSGSKKNKETVVKIKHIAKRISGKKKNLKKMYDDVTGPRSAFQLYVSSMAKKHNEGNENKEKKFNATQIEPKWKDVKDKKPYEEMERQDLLRWLKELHEKHSHQFTPEQEITYYSELKEIGIPCKTPEENKHLVRRKKIPPFFLYSQSKRQELIDSNNGNITNNEARKMLGQKWREMTDDEKQPWIKQSEEMADTPEPSKTEETKA